MHFKREFSTSTKNSNLESVEVENKDLRVYTNVLGLFSFKYPSNWVYSDSLVNSDYASGGHGDILTVDFYFVTDSIFEKPAKVGIIFEENLDSEFNLTNNPSKFEKEKIIFGKHTFFKIIDKNNFEVKYYLPLGNNHAFFLKPEKYSNVQISDQQVEIILESLEINLGRIKANLTDESRRSFVHPLGMYAFSYPSNWSYELGKDVSGISGPCLRKFKSEIKQPYNYSDVCFSVEASYIPYLDEMALKYNLINEKVVFGNNTFYKTISKKDPQDIAYFIPFSNKNDFNLIIEINPGSNITDLELVEVLKTLVI